MDRRKNLLLGMIPDWGPNFIITFETKIVSFVSHGDLLHFTSSGRACCNEGDRVPVVLTVNKRLQVKSFFNGNPDQGFTSTRDLSECSTLSILPTIQEKLDLENLSFFQADIQV